MEVRYYSSFDRSFEKLPSSIQLKVKRGILKFLDYIETHIIPHGLGLKKLKHGFWEIRVGLSHRVLFKMEGDVLQMILVGTHEDIKRFLAS